MVGQAWLVVVTRTVGLMRDLALTMLVVPVFAPLWLLPLRIASAIGAFYGTVAYGLWPLGRRVAMMNLHRAYGSSATRRVARGRAHAAFRHMGRGIGEGLAIARRFKHGPSGLETLYEADDPDLERQIIAESRPCVFVTGHFGSWEAALLLAGLRVGDRGAAIVRRVDNPFVNALVRRVRLRAPGQWIEKRGATGEALRRLRNGESVALLVDENAGARGAFVDFFGRPASTSRTAALLSLLTGAPIVVGAATRQPGRQRLLFKFAVIEPEAGGGEAVTILTQRIVDVLERWIRVDPLQWRWMHWRWKTRPDGSEETYSRSDLAACFDARPQAMGGPDGAGERA